MEQESDPVLARQVVVQFEAELVPRVRLDAVTRGVREIVQHTREVGPHRGQRQNVPRDGTEARERNLVAWERVAHEPRTIRIDARRRRVVDGDEIAARVTPVRKITVVHPGRGNGHDRRRGSGLVAITLVRCEEKRLVPAVIQARYLDRTAKHAAEVVLLDDRLRPPQRLAEVIDCVQLVAPEEFEGLPAPVVAARPRDEAHGAAARVAELCLEAVGIDGELGNGFDRRRIERGPETLLEWRARRRRNAVDRQVPAALLASADDDVAATAVTARAGLRLRRNQAEVQRRSQLSADDERQILDELAGDGGRDLDAVGLNLPGLDRDGDGVLQPADRQRLIHARGATGCELDILDRLRPKPFRRDDDDVGADLELRNGVGALVRRRDGAFEIRRDVNGFHRGVGDDAAGTVGHGTRDGAAIRLRGGGTGCAQERYDGKASDRDPGWETRHRFSSFPI